MGKSMGKSQFFPVKKSPFNQSNDQSETSENYPSEIDRNSAFNWDDWH
jgi:hypothetical protein